MGVCSPWFMVKHYKITEFISLAICNSQILIRFLNSNEEPNLSKIKFRMQIMLWVRNRLTEFMYVQPFEQVSHENWPLSITYVVNVLRFFHNYAISFTLVVNHSMIVHVPRRGSLHSTKVIIEKSRGEVSNGKCFLAYNRSEMFFWKFMHTSKCATNYIISFVVHCITNYYA